MVQRNEVQPGKVSVTPTSVQRATFSGGSRTTEVIWRIPDGWWKNVPSTGSCHWKGTAAESLVGLTTRVWESADRRWRRLPSADVRDRSSARYGGGAVKTLYIRQHT